jgi:hypothetical protein
MGFHYEDAAAQWWKCRPLSTKAPNSPGIENEVSVRRGHYPRATSGGITTANNCNARDNLNTAEREETLGITSEDTVFHCRFLGCSISGQRCSDGDHLLYANAWFRSGHAASARLRPGFNWGSEVNLERSGRIWVPANAQWPSTKVWRMEPRDSSGAGFACAHCRPEKGGWAF